ncbi:MAG: 50S ribosomal protein L29 [Patescibacteria group bacterium]|jgi:ribosomal protein L29|nr:50S ribosomal protein L29 [Patescibacteria group bacterium]
MKAKELKQSTKVELNAKAAELRGMVRDLRFKITTRQNSKVRALRQAKKDLARIETELSSTKQ